MTGRHCAGLAEVLAKPAAAEYSVLAMITRDTAGLDSTFWRGAFLAGVALAVLVIALLAARWRPLWYDELFTLYVASETSVGATVSALLAGADTNPPLDYVLRHLSLALFGESPAAFRWPSALAFIAGLLAIFAYVRRRTGFARQPPPSCCRFPRRRCSLHTKAVRTPCSLLRRRSRSGRGSARSIVASPCDCSHCCSPSAWDRFHTTSGY